MKTRTAHDVFPVQLKGRRKALLTLPIDLTAADVEVIKRQLDFVAECSADHNAPIAAQSPKEAE